MYYSLHEEDITKFYERADEIYTNTRPQTNLNQIRKACSLSLEKLAIESGVPLRTIQMYEQREKDINKAQITVAAKIARALSCSIEDMME
jgi:DNA-binding XRE family transcriptional regulator